MSNIKDKIAEKIPKKLKEDKKPSGRITNDTIAEHREKILAGGRKFKYPLQYSKHKILVNTMIVALVGIIGFSVWLFVMLYRNQSTGDFFYNVTKVLPLPVADVDGEGVPYSDYLRRVRSAIFYKRYQEKIDLVASTEQDEFNYVKRDELDKAEKSAYARKIARANSVTVSDKEVDGELKNSLRSDNGDIMSQDDYETNVLKRYFGWTIEDYKVELRNRILEKKTAFAIDKSAKDKIESIKKQLDNGGNFAEIAKSSSDDENTKSSGGGVVASSGDSDPNGLIAAARQLEPGTNSAIISGVDAYYIVRLDSKTDDVTKFSLIKVKLTQFNSDFDKLKEQNKIREYVDIPRAESAL